MAQSHLALVLAMLVLGCLATSVAAKDCTRKIKIGDIYYEIAKAYGTTVVWLRQKNPRVNENNLKKNQVIVVPCLPSCTYTVKSGGTWATIATATKLAEATLKDLNPTVTTLKSGQVLRTCACKYAVTEGDTWATIAAAYKSSEGALKNLNPGTSTSPKVDTEVNVPCPKACKYTIQNGDTFWSLANSRDSDPATVQSLNPGVVATSLYRGDVVNIPC